ncbi:MAG TPA: hypothetical protein VNI54_04650 [Thermoanaerobaculia bacterium]|nr:hypothetical protein [Thermoanaerobaculia bacterium]
MTWDWGTIDAIDAHIHAALERSGLPTKTYKQRVRRMARAADLLISGKSVASVLDPISGITTSELYGGLWMLLVADLFRDAPEGSGIFGAYLNFTADDWRQLDAVFRLLHERYFGIPPLTIAQPWDHNNTS